MDRITELTHTHGGSPHDYAYGYDPSGRLTDASYPTGLGLPSAPEAFGYDKSGNRDNDPGSASPWSYDDNDRIEASPGDPNDLSYAFDDDGNLTSRSDNGATRTLVWDATNRLEQVVEWMSTAPARRVGLWQKGAIEVGRDADLAIVAPDAAFTVDAAALEHRHPITPYDGRELVGAVRATYLAGEPVDRVEPRGRLLRRGASRPTIGRDA